MVKTVRITNHSLHKELLKIQGRLQAKSGEYTTIELIRNYKKKR